MAALLLLLLAAAALLESTDGQQLYDKLPDSYKAGVDLALEKLRDHAGIQNHFLFFRSIAKSSLEPGYGVTFIYHHFHLKATNCSRGTNDTSNCQFRHDRPLIDCGVCYNLFDGAIEPEPRPYVHCMHRPLLTEEMKSKRLQHCNALGHSRGAHTLLASTADS
ncbi:uncharacterized protein ACB058_001323 [Synchiropus picturatus]